MGILLAFNLICFACFSFGGFLLFGLLYLWYIKKTNQSQSYRFKQRVMFFVFTGLTAANWLWFWYEIGTGEAGDAMGWYLIFTFPGVAVVYTGYLVISFLILRIKKNYSSISEKTAEQ